MKKIFRRLYYKTKRRFNKYVSKHDISSYKIIVGHCNNPKSVLVCDPELGEYFITNQSTHYSLIITPSKVLLVNTKDVIDLDISPRVLERVIKNVRHIISLQRQELKGTILNKKEDILSQILINIKK